MDAVDYLVVGAGMSGLSFANAIRTQAIQAGRSTPHLPEVLILDASSEPGGYCKTIKQDGFVWDYSGHFFHFKKPDIEAWLRARMPDQEVRTVNKCSYIRYAGKNIDFPFQKNIHQLPQKDFIKCLHDLWFRTSQHGTSSTQSFKQMLYERFGQGIAEAFLIPYNEKLYACDLDKLDRNAMGRFFPAGDADDIIRNMVHADNRSYNSTFTYPAGGAIEYVNALLKDLPKEQIALNERLESIDLSSNIAHTSKRSIKYRRLISSQPLPDILAASNISHQPEAFSWNKVLVFNLGFDAKGYHDTHWMYFPDRRTRFYRVGWYDNIINGPRMSLYIEIGGPRDYTFNIEAERQRVLSDLNKEGIVSGQNLIAEHHIVLDPAYVHVTQAAQAEQARLIPILNAAGVYPVGRYGGWTYCSIEDNIIETRALAQQFSASL